MPVFSGKARLTSTSYCGRCLMVYSERSWLGQREQAAMKARPPEEELEHMIISRASPGVIATKLKQKGNSTVALPCEICGELCPSDRLMQHQDECSQELDTETGESTPYPTASAREESDLLHFRFHVFREIGQTGKWMTLLMILP
ncbi:hypothetical protein OS493_012510 [Desmophyllum pertusum]|uniref:Uncharacterized protein n=1 Tax=Desmophyllum pertusum TaxID=174260 RepID=A0A9W9ZGT9_9CNID|nr:hypothetical protein OS493_012510 [Desmophyllum pertusum]